MEEQWKDIAGFEGYYQISSMGRVKSVERYIQQTDGMKRPYKIPERILKPKKKPNGYMGVGLAMGGKVQNSLIHRMVAEAFIPNPDNLPTVNHKNEDKTDNRMENLEWCSVAYNNTYGTRLERTSKQPHNHPVIMLDIEGNQLRRFQSVCEAARHLISDGRSIVGKKITANSIRAVCQHKAQRHTAYGYRWEFSDEVNPDGIHADIYKQETPAQVVLMPK